MRRWPPDLPDKPRSWSDRAEDELEALRLALNEAKRDGVHLTPRQATIVLDLIRAYRRLTVRPGAYGGYDGLPPTVGDAKRNGAVGIYVHCEGLHEGWRCWASREFRWGDLPLNDGAMFLDIPRRLRFRCLKCDGRKVSIMAVYPAGPGMGGAHGGRRP